jgi:uncharacterized protein YcbX
VTGLSTAPIKGLRLRSHELVELGLGGVADDRRFYLIDAKGRMVNGKQLGSLTAVLADYDAGEGELSLRFPDGTTTSERVELGARVQTRFHSRPREARLVIGPWAAALSDHAGQELRLVQPDAGTSAVDRGVGGGVSLMSRASLARLEHAAASGIDARRFRMLIEIDGVDAHAEDDWVGSRVRIGAALVLMRGHVGRCLVTSRDPDSGVVDLPTLDLLRGYRESTATTEPLAFGIYGEVIEEGRIALGDPVLPA